MPDPLHPSNPANLAQPSMPAPPTASPASKAAAVVHPLSEAALREAIVALALAAAGIREKDGPNRGEPFDTYNRSAGVAPGSPYCVSLWHHELGRLFKQLGVRMPLRIGASTSGLAQAAGRAGRLRPGTEALPGDLLLFRKAVGAYYHTGLVVAVLAGGSLRTVEGNTSSGSGVVSEGDGVYRRRRDSARLNLQAVDLCLSRASSDSR